VDKKKQFTPLACIYYDYDIYYTKGERFVIPTANELSRFINAEYAKRLPNMSMLHTCNNANLKNI